MKPHKLLIFSVLSPFLLKMWVMPTIPSVTEGYSYSQNNHAYMPVFFSWACISASFLQIYPILLAALVLVGLCVSAQAHIHMPTVIPGTLVETILQCKLYYSTDPSAKNPGFCCRQSSMTGIELLMKKPAHWSLSPSCSPTE